MRTPVSTVVTHAEPEHTHPRWWGRRLDRPHPGIVYSDTASWQTRVGSDVDRYADHLRIPISDEERTAARASAIADLARAVQRKNRPDVTVNAPAAQVAARRAVRRVLNLPRPEVVAARATVTVLLAVVAGVLTHVALDPTLWNPPGYQWPAQIAGRDLHLAVAAQWITDRRTDRRGGRGCASLRVRLLSAAIRVLNAAVVAFVLMLAAAVTALVIVASIPA